jgi:hypothetical protein
MGGSARMVPVGPPRAVGPASLHARRPLILSVVAVAAAAAAGLMLAHRADGFTLDYEVGIVPAVVPWAASVVAIASAILWLSGRGSSSTAGSLLLGALVVLTAWTVVMLPFDALRLVGLVPLPLSGWGASMRLLVLLSAACAFLAGQALRQASQVRCPGCSRVLPGPLDRLPRWPVGMAVVAACVYPTLRVIWALGGTFGTTGDALEMDAATAWGVVGAGAGLVAFTVALLVGRGPTWARAFLGLGGAMLGLLMTVMGGLGALKAAETIASEGSQAVIADLMAWTYALVYGSWCLAGIGIIVGGWRFWSHRRDDCPTCRTVVSSS